MGKEIERKFLVINENYRSQSTAAYDIMQGYISTDPCRTVRVRIKGDRAFITVKGITEGCKRDEWEYEIPLVDAREMLERLCGTSVLSKTRYIVPCGLLNWEVDEFHGLHEGLVVAEVELPDAGSDIGPLPDFVGREVTGDTRYYNSSLVQD